MMPKGFVAAGVAAGIKASGAPDVAILSSDRPATAAGVVTTNRVKAAPILLAQRTLQRGTARAIVANAGNANACTGDQGDIDARAMAAETAAALALASADDVLVASTGVIGVPMPMGAALAGIRAASAALREDGVADLARAIMTTDTKPKIVSVDLGGASILGIAKGAGMIAPEMATMLAFLATDAAVDKDLLGAALRTASARSFNMISVDGCMSTNDCVFALANGASGDTPISAGDPRAARFVDAMTAVCAGLARMMVEDGEGATKILSIRVDGAATADEARVAASTVGSSVLLRCAVHGADPNWGRVLAALGTADIPFDPRAVDVWVGGEKLCESGAPGPGRRERAAERMRAREVEIVVDMNRGDATATLLTNDLSTDYIRINAEYTT